MQYVPIEEIIRIQKKGIITIPKNIRQDLGIDENDLVRMKTEKGKVILEPVRTLPYGVRTYSPREIEEFLALDKQESKQLKKKKLL